MRQRITRAVDMVRKLGSGVNGRSAQMPAGSPHRAPASHAAGSERSRSHYQQAGARNGQIAGIARDPRPFLTAPWRVRASIRRRGGTSTS